MFSACIYKPKGPWLVVTSQVCVACKLKKYIYNKNSQVAGPQINAPLLELVDISDLGSEAARCKSSSLLGGTKV